MPLSRFLLATITTSWLGLAACGGDTAPTSVVDPTPASTVSSADPAVGSSGIRVVAPGEAAATIAAPPDDLVILDVRTPEEFEEGHIDGAVMLDFYRDDFADELSRLDRDVPYVVYCRSGNRSGQTRAMMDELGFASVADVDGGIVGWVAADLPVVTE